MNNIAYDIFLFENVSVQKVVKTDLLKNICIENRILKSLLLWSMHLGVPSTWSEPLEPFFVGLPFQNIKFRQLCPKDQCPSSG